MAIAPFFDKVALAAASVLRGFDRSAFEAKLIAQNVALVFGDQAASTTEGKVAVELTANLLARLYPNVTIIAYGPSATAFASIVTEQVRAINPLIDAEVLEGSASSCDAIATIAVVIGDDAPFAGKPAIHIGSSGWTAYCSAHAARTCGTTNIPFGAAAAACIGSANVFRYVFAEELGGSGLDSDVALSLATYSQRSHPPEDGSIGEVDIGTIHLAGLGAIGNAFLWTLAKVPTLAGTIHGIDPEVIQASNAQRYVLTTSGDDGRSKTDVAIGFLGKENPGVKFVPHKMTWGEFLATEPPPWRLERVVVALDSSVDRIGVQASLPRWICNGWTQPGDLGVSRHRFRRGEACLTCLYFPSGTIKNEDQLVAEAVGLAGHELAVRKLLHTGEAVGIGVIRNIAEALKVSVDELVPYADRPLRDFYSEAICGGVILRLQAQSADDSLRANYDRGSAGGTAEAPMAFQSALAGVLLASELARDVLRLGVVPETKTVINLLSPLGTNLNVNVAPEPSGRCVCQDDDFVAVFNNHFSELA